MMVWGWMVTIYLFLGGLSAGCFASSVWLYLKSNGKYSRTAEWGAFWSWVIIALGIILLVLDLGRTERAFNTMIHPHLVSPMSWGSLIIVGFMILSLAYWLTFTEIPEKLVKISLKPLRTPIGYLGVLLAFMTGAYTGILLTYGRMPLWSSPALPLLFLASALATGYSLFMGITHDIGEVPGGLRAKLGRNEVILALIELIAVAIYLSMVPSVARQSLLSLSGYGAIFIAVFLIIGLTIGEIILPIVESKAESGAILGLSILLTQIGGIALRYVIVFLGQSL